ncbi:hypothetical protein KKF84_06510 [Myxococcota bacterium]|nr:hypothetical protein [Myxococcota bacterium]MBU1534952.1 hypothetical protein [Myxococcota bacterium]
MRTRFSMLLVALLSLALVASCGKKDEEKKDGEKAPEAMKGPKKDSMKPGKGMDAEMKAEVKPEKKVEAPTGPLKDAPEIEWKGYKKTKLTIKSIAKSEVWFYMASLSSSDSGPLTLNISTRELPEGTKVVLGDKTFTVDKRKYGYFKYSVKDIMGPLPLSAVYHKRSYKKKYIKLGVKFKVELPGFKAIEGEVPAIDPSSSVKNYMREVEDGKVLFKGEPKYDGKVRNLIVATKYGSPYIAGKGDKIWDLDLVAVVNDEPSTVVKKCKMTIKKKVVEVAVTLIDAKVTIYNRHTGEKVSTEVVKHGGKCPYYATVKAGNTATHTIDSSDLHKWADKAFKKLKK